MKKLLFTLIIALLATVNAWAAETGDKFKIGDLWYAIISSTEKTVMVDWDVRFMVRYHQFYGKDRDGGLGCALV